jgi:hypothetical protein
MEREKLRRRIYTPPTHEELIYKVGFFHCKMHNALGQFWFKFIFSAHMIAMELELFVGTKKVCFGQIYSS